MDEKKMNNDTEMNVGMLEDALIDTLKEVTIKFSKDSYICRILTNTIHLINRQKAEIERLKRLVKKPEVARLDGSMVLSRDEWIEIQSKLLLADDREHQAVKATARGILQELWDETEPLNESHKWVRLRIKHIASRKGVEVE